MGKKKQTPLMYIQQPTFKSTDSKMQSIYQASNNKPVSTHKTKKVSTKTLAKKRSGEDREKTNGTNEQMINDEVTNNKEKVEEEAQPKQESENHRPNNVDQINSNRRFSEMTKEEQINYLYRSIPWVAKLKAEFQTEEQVYRGIIVNYDGQEVELKNMHRPFRITLNKNEIKEIRLLGF